MKKLLLCVTYTAKNGMREQFVHDAIATGVLNTIQAEDGCLGYEYHFAAQDANKVLLVEQWESEEKQAAHLKQPHMEKLKALKEAYILDTQVTKAYLPDEQ